MLHSTKYKKMVFKSSVREDATFHSTFILHMQIGGKLENILNKLLKKHTVHVLHQNDVPTSDHWRILQHTFKCFRTKTRHAAGRMKPFRKGHMTCWMLSIKRDCLLCTKRDCFVQNIRYLLGTSDVTTISNDRGDILQNSCKTSLKKNEYCCVVQMNGSEHMQCFRWFRSDAVIFRFRVFSSRLQHFWRTYRANIHNQLIENTTIVSVDVILSV